MKSFLYFLLFASLFIGACEDPIQLGAGLVDSEVKDPEFTDTLELVVRTVEGEPPITYRNSTSFSSTRYLLGSIQDPVFGRYSSETYFNTYLSTSFPDLRDAIIDSVVLVITLDSTAQYGNEEEIHTIEVFQLSEELDVETGEATMAYQLVAEAKDRQGGDVQIIRNKRITTIEEAISIAVRKMEDDLARWIKSQWPLILKIIDVENKRQIVVIEGGRDVGLSKKHKMKAITLKVYESSGKKRIDTIGKLNYTREGVGEETTTLKMSSKKDWESFLKLWKEDSDRIYVTEDL